MTLHPVEDQFARTVESGFLTRSSFIMYNHNCKKCNGTGKTWVLSPFITKNGRKVYRKNGKVFRFLGVCSCTKNNY